MQTLMQIYHKELADISGFAPDTVENYEICVQKFFDFATRQLNIEPLGAGAKDLLTWMAHLKQQQLSRSRLTHHKAALKHFFGLLVKQKKRQDNPVELLFTPRKKKSDRNQPVSPAIVLKLLRSGKRDTWLGERNFMIISMLWALGLRIAELTSLKVGSFEPAHEPENKVGLLRVQGKGKKERALFVVDKLYSNLVGYLGHPETPKQMTSPMFPIPNNKSKQLSTDRARGMMKEVTREAGIKLRITPHVLRHSFATHMYSNGVPVEAIEAMLGHTTTDETSIYIHVPKTRKKQALAKITIERPAFNESERS
ncbi:MAG: tyrosine-type recombinase/integrase [Nitrosomonadaceae bacterium]